MDYDTVLKKINPLGRYQIFRIILLALGGSMNSLTSFVINFIMTEHPHRCRLPEYLNDTYNLSLNLNATNGSSQFINVHECDIEINNITFKCDSWVYEDNFFQTTIISKFNIVCDRKLYRAHFLATYYAGIMVGSIVGGFFGDIFGRRPILALAFLCLSVSMISRPFLEHFTLVIAMEFFNGFGSIVAYIMSFIILNEMTGPSKRTLVTFCLWFGFDCGSYVFLVIVYFVRYWENLMLAVGIPIGVYLLLILFIDETPRWLLSRGKTKRAVKILSKMASINKTQFEITDIRHRKEEQSSYLMLLYSLIRTKSLLWRLFIVSIGWVSLNLIYFGISMNVARFGDDVFANYAISQTAELLGITFSWLVADKIGRKKLFCSAMILGGLSCFCTIFTTLYTRSSKGWMTTALAMIGKFFATTTFYTVYLLTGEMFPTVLRGSAFGFASMLGRIGSISSAYIAELGTIFPTKLGQALPLVIYGGFGLLAGFLSLYLPETTKVVLPDYVKDAKMIKRFKENKNEGELLQFTEKTEFDQ